MGIVKMNILDIMAEAAKTSVVNTNNITIDEIAESVTETISSLEEMNIDLKFTPEMIPVVFDEATGNYYVEYDMLAKLLECGDCISLDTKYGKICFEPKTDDCKMADSKDEVITEEEPETTEDTEEPEADDTIDESYLNPFFTCPQSVGCWEKDALNQVILANMVRDPNREEIDCNQCCDDIPEMTMENTCIVIESEEKFAERIQT